MFSRYRKFVVIGAALALLVGATAGPLAASSSNKTYTAAISPASLPYSSSGTSQGPVTITLTNTTPSASINSLTVTAPTGYTITALAATPVTESSGNAGNYNISLTNHATITVTNLSPVSYLGTVSVSFTASTTWTTLSCSTNSAAWTTTAWTGSNLSGNQFTLSGNAPTISIGTNLAVGATITVNGVSLTNNGTSCVPVTISRNGNSVTILKPTAPSDAFTLDVVWDPEPAALPLHVDTVTAAGGTTNILWCGGTPASLTVPAGQVSCLVSELAKVYGPDASGNPQIQVEDVVNLIGDYSIVRG